MTRGNGHMGGPPCEQTDSYENITFPQLHLRAVKKKQKRLLVCRSVGRSSMIHAGRIYTGVLLLISLHSVLVQCCIEFKLFQKGVEVLVSLWSE